MKKQTNKIKHKERESMQKYVSDTIAHEIEKKYPKKIQRSDKKNNK